MNKACIIFQKVLEGSLDLIKLKPVAAQMNYVYFDKTHDRFHLSGYLIAGLLLMFVMAKMAKACVLALKRRLNKVFSVMRKDRGKRKQEKEQKRVDEKWARFKNGK